MRVLIRGAGDIATGIALRLYRSHMQVVMTDLPAPTAIRRTVCFSQAIVLGRTEVEGVAAVLAADAAEAESLLAQEVVPVLADPDCRCRQALRPDAEVDAILAKRNLGTAITDAPVVIGIGPGFTAGADCHAVVETMRGHTLGRVIYEGSALPNTNIPGLIGGYAGERVLRAPADGIFHQLLDIGAEVKAGDVAGEVNGLHVESTSNLSAGSSLDRALVGDFENCFKWGYAKEIPIEVIRYGNPDNDTQLGDLKGHNQVYLRGEAYIGWGILDPSAFAHIKAGE